MNFIEGIAIANFAVIDLIFLEIFLSVLFVVDKKGNIKSRLDTLSGLSQYIPTYLYVLVFMGVGLIYFFITELFQDFFINLMVQYIGYPLILSCLALLSFSVFWICKIILGRKFRFHLCLLSFIFWLLFSLLFLLFFVLKYVK